MNAYIAITRTDGSVAHMCLPHEIRAPSRPRGPNWTLLPTGLWSRLVGGVVTDSDIEYELARLNMMWGNGGDPLSVSWRRLTQQEHEFFERDRDYRDAIEDNAGTLGHNMVKARNLHRAKLRHLAGDQLIGLDREWVNAAAARNNQDADAVEAKRQALRDAPNDPAIDAAQTIAELKLVDLPKV